MFWSSLPCEAKLANSYRKIFKFELNSLHLYSSNLWSPIFLSEPDTIITTIALESIKLLKKVQLLKKKLSFTFCFHTFPTLWLNFWQAHLNFHFLHAWRKRKLIDWIALINFLNKFYHFFKTSISSQIKNVTIFMK